MTKESDLNVGDRVRIEKDGEAHEGYVMIHNDGSASIGSGATSLSWRIKEGWTLTVLEKAAPALPTEEGAYVDKYGHDVWTISSFHGIQCVSNPGSSPTKYAPFTRLEPVPVTVQKVIAQLDELGYMVAARKIAQIFAEPSS